eukprot:TRINITY_DN976_c0_g1_i1.p1 TRINITY_DN976_c0_g1~~TRINITY_DN976_c0_g1_i1.p1  ORF type:complete len:730 (+),score=278.21 TRINITY_DN976_c0_g1_i1:116-2305(+)
MKGTFAFLTLLLLVGAASADAGRSHSKSANPVSRVVNLLKDLGDKLEKEGKAEKELYDKFTCWGTTTVNEKTKAMAAATERIEYLKNYITQIESGAVWFTQEKETIEKEIAAVNATMNNNQDNRTEDHDHFLKEAEATESGLDGLAVGLDALADAAAPSPDDPTVAFVALRGSKHANTAVERVKYTQKLRTALNMAQQYLDTSDYVFMRDVVTGRVNTKVVSKEEPDAKVTGTYKSRLGGVIDKLKEVSMNMAHDLEEDTKADKEAQVSYEKRQETKAKQKAAQEALLAKLDGEYAARAKAKAESEEEIDALTEQNKEDDALIKAVTAQLEEKAQIWDQRLTYRTGEQEAVGKAIEILHSDESRDLFAKSTAFLQVSAISEVQVARARSAGKVLLDNARQTKNHHMMVLAAQLARVSTEGNPTFDIVLQKIDDMKAVIKAEGEADLKKKEDCEATRTADEKTAKDHSNQMEDLNSQIGFLNSKIQEIDEDLAKKDAQIAQVNTSLAAAKSMRDAENAEYVSSKKDDQDAAALLAQAAKVIQDFYDSKGSFIQIKSKDAPLEAPEDMPKVFNENYGGAGAQGKGVIQTLKTVEDDMHKEIAEADKEEQEALAAYNVDKTDLENEKATLQGEVDSLLILKGETQDNLGTAKTDLSETEDLKKIVEKKMKEALPECDFYLKNLETRDKNREVEMNGLDKAKAILNGAVFEDKSREITIGDSLLSKEIKPHSF